MRSLRRRPAESSQGALRHPGFGLSASAPGFRPRRLPSRLTSRSSRRRVVASLKLTGMRAILAPIRRVRRGLTPALDLMTKPDETLYQNIAKQSEQLGYRDKLRLAQLLIQLARKEEEETYPQERTDAPTMNPTDPEMIQYVAARLVKLRPARKPAVLNAIGAMFQFQGSVSDSDKEIIISELLRRKLIAIDSNGRISYTSSA
jgi:hypothetical protein